MAKIIAHIRNFRGIPIRDMTMSKKNKPFILFSFIFNAPVKNCVIDCLIRQ
jgi:hypothetical protein